MATPDYKLRVRWFFGGLVDFIKSGAILEKSSGGAQADILRYRAYADHASYVTHNAH